MSDWLIQTFRRALAVFSKRDMDNDLDAEMRAHIDLATEEYIGRGLSPAEARRQALIRFGGRDSATELHRDTRGLPLIEVLMQDLRYAFRTFRRDRVFTLVAVLILAVGIGANVAVFSVINAILLRPLPFSDPQRLAWLASNRGEGGLSAITYNVESYEEFQRHNQSFEQIAGYNPFMGDGAWKLLGRGEPQPVDGIQVTGNFFQTLGVQPAVGRFFLPEECKKGGRPAVILSNAFWHRQFGGDPGIVGQSITLDSSQVTVVGVLPESFDFSSVFFPASNIDAFGPAILDDLRDTGNVLSMVGRLKPGVTFAQAQAEATALLPELRAAHPNWEEYSATIWSLKDYVSGKLQRSLIVLWSAVGLIFLIICVNLSNLMLARTAARNKEFALRSALGAGRGRLARQLLTESLALSITGSIFGVGLGFALTTYFSHQTSVALPLLSRAKVDWYSLGWAALIGLAATLLLGIGPIFKISSGTLSEALKDSGQGLSEGNKHARLRSILVISEMALACVLLVGAGLLLRSFVRVLDVDLGFNPENASAITVDIRDPENAAKRGAELQEVIRKVEEIPGVESAGISDMLPLGRNRNWGLWAKGRLYSRDSMLGAYVRVVSPGYLRAMGMRLVGGRDFTWDDGPKGQPVIIINQAAARLHWLGQDPVGRTAYVAGSMECQIVGVISDVRQRSLEQAAGPEFFIPITQAYPEGADLVIRSKLPPQSLQSTVMNTLRSLNPTQPVAELRPIQRIVDKSVSPRRFFVMLVAVFALLGLVLAALGIYGVISYSVARQTQEIGIRRALGATGPQVQLSVIARTLRLALIGVILGIIASVAVGRWIASLLFGTQPGDPATLAVIVLMLGIVALIAGYIPARRAARVDPVVALRGN